MKKSYFVQLILALFGPLGLFYSSPATAWFLIILALVSGVLTFGIGALLVWALSPIVGFLSVSYYNAKLADENKKHDEPIRGTGAAKQVGPSPNSVECPQ